MNKDIRYWFIQKPMLHNMPIDPECAVFQTFRPTNGKQNCEWIEVLSKQDLQKHLGKNLSHYIELSRENLKLQKQVEVLKEACELVLRKSDLQQLTRGDAFYILDRNIYRQVAAALEKINEIGG